MLNCIAIGPTQGLLLALQGMCAEMKDVFLIKVVDNFPGTPELARLANIYDPEAFFVEIHPLQRCLEVIRELRQKNPATVLIGYTRNADRTRLAEAAEAGIGEMLVAPFSVEDLRAALVRSFEARSPGVYENVLAFLPSKAGSGASVVALNSAGALAGGLSQNVLVLDADRSSGVLSVFSNIEPAYSVAEMLESSHELNDGLWGFRRTKVHGFDMLPMPRRRMTASFPPWNYQRLLNFARQRYGTVIVDLPESVEPEADTFVKQARNVYVVCTPEMPSIFLAQRRIEDLLALGIAEDRIGVILNRSLPREGLVAEFERLVGRTAAAILPDDPASVRDSIVAGSLVPQDTELGAAFASFARKLAGLPPLPAAQPVAQTSLMSMFRRRVLQSR